MTNGTVDSAHYGPIGDAARHIASYCDGPARVHVYTAAFDRLSAAKAQRDELARQLEAAREGLAGIDAISDDADDWKISRMKKAARAALARITPKEPV